jgi:hypothetical protein
MSSNIGADGGARRGVIRDRLFKTDHFRSIDQVIDYFGGRELPRWSGDRWSESSIERPCDRLDRVSEDVAWSGGSSA